MSDWNTLTEQDVLNRFNPQEQAAFNTLAGQDNLATVVGDVVLTIRGAIKAAGGQRGAEGTIPNSLKVAAVSMAAWLWLTSYSRNDQLLTDGRRANYQDALAALALVREGRHKVELPDPGSPDQTAAPVGAIEQASGSRRQWKHGL
jgi:hypothetical protein